MRIALTLLLVFAVLMPLAAQPPLLHATRGIHAGVYDSSGNYVLLRGVNYNVLGEYWQGVPDAPTTKEYSDKDLEMMAQYGFNSVRLLFTWSRLEPQRGHYDTAYIARVCHAIETAARLNMYVLVDMHQDAWGMYIATPDTGMCREPAKGWDGAPRWATITNGQPTCTQGGRESAPAVVRAFRNFWDDTDSLQEACIAAWCKMVAATSRYNNVVGYDLLNEPGLGDHSLIRGNRQHGRYCRNLVRAIRQTETAAANPHHIIFFEPTVTKGGKEIPSIPQTTFRPERNIIFAPHHYFESITGKLNMLQGFQILRIGAFLYHTDLYIGEWGFFGGVQDTAKIKRYARYEDKWMLGSAWWQWCQACGDPHSVGWNGHQWQAGNSSMHLIELDRTGKFTGNVNTSFLHILDRPRPLSVCGRPRKGFMSNPATGTLQLQGHTHKAGNITIWVPQRFNAPQVTGKNVSLTQTTTVPGGYKLSVAVKGKYKLHMQPKN